MEIWMIITPVITFILGVVSTWWFKNREKEKQKIKDAVCQIAQLSTDWYHQLEEIRVAVIMNQNPETIREMVMRYSQNRLILPKLQQNVMIISGDRKYRELKDAVDDLLECVTTCETRTILSRNQEFLICISCNSQLIGRDDNFKEDYRPLLELRSQVDTQVQHINKTAGSILRKL